MECLRLCQRCQVCQVCGLVLEMPRRSCFSSWATIQRQPHCALLLKSRTEQSPLRIPSSSHSAPTFFVIPSRLPLQRPQQHVLLLEAVQNKPFLHSLSSPSCTNYPSHPPQATPPAPVTTCARARGPRPRAGAASAWRSAGWSRQGAGRWT